MGPDNETLTCLVCGRDLMVRRPDGTTVLPDADLLRTEHADCLRTAIRAAGSQPEVRRARWRRFLRSTRFGTGGTPP